MATTTKIPQKKIPTINLKGKEYAQVKDRVQAFNSDNERGSITTEVLPMDSQYMIKAIVIPDVDKPERKFIAHSLGKVGADKAFEKLESVAVGRALAYAGYGIDGSIASYEEMEAFYEKTESVEAKPKITNEQINGMLDFIKQGKIKEVEQGMSKYEIPEPTHKMLTDAINNYKNDLK